MGGRGKCLLTNVQLHGEGVTTTHGNTEFILGGWVCVYAFCQGAQNKRHSGVLLNAKGEGDEEVGITYTYVYEYTRLYHCQGLA